MAVNITQEVVYNGLCYTIQQFDVTNSQPYVQNSAYRLAIWENEAVESGAKFVIRTYAIPEDGLAEVWAHLNDPDNGFHPTIAYPNSDRKFIAVMFVDADGTARPWMEFKTLDIGIEAKTPKRLGKTGTWTYLNDVTTIRIVHDGEYYPREEGVVTVRILPTPPDFEPHVDGSFWIREELRQDLYNKALDRVSDQEKRDYLAETLMGTDAYNARFTLNDFSLKGDVEVADELNADVVAYDCNLYYSITTKIPGQGILMLTPQEQGGSVRTNRQSIAHFWDALFAVRTPVFGPSMGIVRDAFMRQVNNELQAFQSGKLMSFVSPQSRVEDDQIRSVQSKAVEWVKAKLSINDSLYLMMALASQRMDMWDPKEEQDEEKKRTSLPVPYARRWSLRNETSFNMTRGEHSHLSSGSAYVDEFLGMIVNDPDWADVIESLGGADKDDHIEEHARVLVKDWLFRGIQFKAGETVLVLLRSPIGMLSDGSVIASEYYVLRPTAEYDRTIKARYGQLPELDPDLMPVHILDLQETFPAGTKFRENQAINLPSSYSKAYFKKLVEAASESQFVYDKHSATRRKLRLHGIPFDPHDAEGRVVKEEFFIDEVAQVRSVEGLKFVADNTTKEKQLLPELAPPTILDSLVLFHQVQTRRFEKAARTHIQAVAQSLETHYEALDITRMQDGKPVLLARIDAMEERYREEHNITGRLSYWDFENIGTAVVNRITELELHKGSSQTRVMTYRDVAEAHAFILTQVKPSFRTTSIRSMYYNTDQQLMQGSLFNWLVKVLA